ncbi:MAG: peptidoglycan DD-metalloendopeptidase family protein [Oscillospiraceae bacterium]|nr:peptidoglycan DD-metalloendopeptidase family protein [Oscillospiraceae bacterium]
MLEKGYITLQGQTEIKKIESNRAWHKKLAVAVTAVVLCLVSLIIISGFTGNTASARVTQTQINRLRAEKREYEKQKNEVQTKIDAIEFERMAEMEKKEILDTRITLTDLEIKNTTETIEQLHLLIREMEYDVFLAQANEESQFQKYRSRVRDMEENGIYSYLEIIFDSTSFSDLLARLDFVADIMRADKTLFDSLQIARSETEEAKADLEETREELEEEKIELEIKEAELLVQLEEAHEIIFKLEADIETESEMRDQLIAEENRIQREINVAVERLRKQQEAERERLRRLREQQNRAQSNTGSGSTTGSSGGDGGGSSATMKFAWPVPGGSTISRWGASRGSRVHQGHDIGGAHGANVIAGESGTVIKVAYGSGYGNYVTIAHGNGIQTLYSHLSSSIVNVGDYVTRGQVIGYVGSTGNATTPHLHFEVFVNGRRVNPANWL